MTRQCDSACVFLLMGGVIYLKEIGINHGFLDIILAHRSTEVYRLSIDEMRQYGLIGFDNMYLNERVNALKKNQKTVHIDRVSLFARSMAVPTLCKDRVLSNQSFIDCYSAALSATTR